jgi:nicotinamidase-related amidase
MRALLCIDLINEIVHPDGKLAAKGYAAFAERHNSLKAVASVIADFRAADDLVIHVGLGFKPDYSDLNPDSPLLGGAMKNGILVTDTWSTAFISEVEPSETESVLRKKRISAFHGTNLDTHLHVRKVTDLVIVGVATDIAVSSAARGAHDLDYRVHVVAGGCIAATDDDHAAALACIGKFARVV